MTLSERINRGLPTQITSYDLLKSFALITMIIDHVGAFLYPEQMEWRVIGRFSMPVWLFLVGYAQSRDLSKSLWIGGGILVVFDLFIGQGVFDLNILFTILFVRMTLDFVMRLYLSNREGRIFTLFLIILLVVPTSYLFDYGTHAWLFAMLGYLVRHKVPLSISNVHLLIFAGIITMARTMTDLVFFDFSVSQNMLASLGIFLICVLMLNFKSKIYQDGVMFSSKVLKNSLKIMGRWSLEIYVLHILLLKSVGIFKFPEKYHLLDFSLF